MPIAFVEICFNLRSGEGVGGAQWDGEGDSYQDSYRDSYHDSYQIAILIAIVLMHRPAMPARDPFLRASQSGSAAYLLPDLQSL